MNDSKNTETCVRSMYLRPSGDVSAPFDHNAILVLDTDLKMDGHECKDMRLGDLLVSLEDMIQMARTDHKDVECVEIMCMPGKSVDVAYRPMR
jgi:hypothetical protein